MLLLGIAVAGCAIVCSISAFEAWRYPIKNSKSRLVGAFHGAALVCALALMFAAWSHRGKGIAEWEVVQEQRLTERYLHFPTAFRACVKGEHADQKISCGRCISLYYNWPRGEDEFNMWDAIVSGRCPGIPAMPKHPQ